MFLVAVVFWGVLRHSKPATYVFVFSVLVVLACIVATWTLTKKPASFIDAPDENRVLALQIISVTMNIFGALAGISMFFGILRAFFSFFTTVPIGGVWIGTAALVCVLSVMSGFESDLREKILGSNAHIQITREDGEFTEWRDIKARVDNIPGVVASTPFAVSEVVIAAHNNGMNVIIKGIDPKTVGKVTDLVSDLEDKEAMQRLDPLIDDSPHLTVPQHAKPTGVIDPPPDDMPTGGEPIDFSAPADAAGSAAAAPPDDRDLDVESPEAGGAYGGDAAKLVHATDAPAVVDPPPADLITSDEPPADYSHTDLTELPIDAVDVPEPTLSKRTQSLPGVLVGRELVKQTHLYTGEEVRVVSPLSDPSNPDATGTPIPFNRDYRVAGIFYTGMYEYDLKYVYVSLDSLQNFLVRGDAVDGIEVRIGDADDTPQFVKILQDQLGASYRIQDWHELNRSLFSALKLEKIAMFLVLGIVILVASFSIVGNLIMVVVEKAREIALLKTLGASDVGVMQLFAIQGLLIGVIGTLLGVATGLLGCWAGMRFGLPLNPDVYYIDRLPIHVEPQSVLASAAAGVFISIAATMYPALLAARVRPAAGMRH
jgi:lipoprotein-releasing system permease protein